jgi:large subunit ribosomal protein L29
MIAKELRGKTTAELQQLVLDLTREGFNLRMQRAYGHVVGPNKFRELRRDVARIKTLLREQEIGLRVPEIGKA